MLKTVIRKLSGIRPKIKANFTSDSCLLIDKLNWKENDVSCLTCHQGTKFLNEGEVAKLHKKVKTGKILNEELSFCQIAS